MKKLFLIILLFALNLPVLALTDYEQIIDKNQGVFLTYEDLVQLSMVEKPEGKLKNKLDLQLNTPIIFQPAVTNPVFLHGMILGNFIRVASWNIERGFNISLIENLFLRNTSQSKHESREELEILSNAQIVILNEVDIGLPRTHYQNIVKHLANTLKMGYVFGTEFIEVDPYQLGIKKFTEEEKTFLEEEALRQLDNIEKDKFHGLHGNAILSKFPIIDAKIIRLPECYNWYKKESEKLSALELLRRGTAEQIFSEKVLTELRHGNRIALVTNLKLPNKETLTVVATHLENRCMPECRYKQLEYLLHRLRNIKNPLILAGDFNTTGTDASPTSIKKEVLKKVKNPAYIAKQAILYLTPLSIVQNFALNTANAFRSFKDPTTKDIPILFPNKERLLFDLIKEYRFNDGGAFDTRGIAEKSHGSTGYLSNSNERELKGFKSTFELQKNFGVARFKLDWIFVKPKKLKNSYDKKGSYAFAPHFGRTLKLANRIFGEKISDHDPITVDIPIGEPVN